MYKTNRNLLSGADEDKGVSIVFGGGQTCTECSLRLQEGLHLKKKKMAELMRFPAQAEDSPPDFDINEKSLWLPRYLNGFHLTHQMNVDVFSVLGLCVSDF